MAAHDNEESARIGDFEKVKEFIEKEILKLCQAVSIKALHKIYGPGFCHENEKFYRKKLKARIVSEFGVLLTFLKIDGVTPEVVVSTKALDSTTIIRDKNRIY